jgi:plastocyanin
MAILVCYNLKINKMRIKLYFINFLLFGLTALVSATTYTITNVGTTFSPNTLTVKVGDTIDFTLEPAHNAVEVNKDVYDAGGNTSNGGFSVPFGGGRIIMKNAGTFYFVCQPHAFIGMKGIITVTSNATLVTRVGNKPSLVNIFPNPSTGPVTIQYSLSNSSTVKIDLYDMMGRVVKNILSSDQSTGNYNLSYNLDDVVSGKYFVRFSIGNQYDVQPLLIRKIE